MSLSKMQIYSSTSGSESESEGSGSIDGLEGLDPMNQVLSNDMLLEQILKDAIHFKEGHGTKHEVNPDIGNFRLVGRNWIEIITKLHRQVKYPLFHLQLSQENTQSLLGTPKKYLKVSLLDRFIAYMAYWGWTGSAGEGLPPFHLELTPTFFKVANRETYQVLFKFFEKFAHDSMIRFTFNFQRSSFDYVPSAFPNFNLCNLRFMELTIERMAWSFVPFIQKLLESSPNLEVLELISSTFLVAENCNYLPPVVDAVGKPSPLEFKLPGKVRKVLLYSTADACSCYYKIVLDNLPQLDTLALCPSACMKPHLSDIFAALSKQLVHLHLIGFKSCTNISEQEYKITFPRLPRLETLTVSLPWLSNISEWFDCDTFLPSLKELTVIHDVNWLFLNFLKDQKVFGVRRATLLFVSRHRHRENGNIRVGVRLAATQLPAITAMEGAYPYLTHLGISVVSDCGGTLEHVINNMTSLKSLAVYVGTNNGRFHDENTKAVNWDSLFTGLYPYACEAMMDNDNPGYWDTINIFHDDEKYPSIRKMKDLEALYLIEVTYPEEPELPDKEMKKLYQGSWAPGGTFSRPRPNPNSADPKFLFSELSFHFAFNRMRKLKTLILTEGFMPAQRVQNNWVGKGRKILRLKTPHMQDLMTSKFSLADDSWYYD